jgi:putative Ca2+/H+ antiporter (TMEM165/GDT1 family)
VFFSVFLLVLIGELGDKTQIAAGTGTLANRGRVRVIYLSSCLALISVSGLTVFAAGLIPHEYVPAIKKIGGVLLAGYGLYLLGKASTSPDADEVPEIRSNWKLFSSHFSVVFMAELGDKTQIATLASAVANQSNLLLIFAASASALVTVTTITIWGITKIPLTWVTHVQRAGAAIMIMYGIYMFI